MTPHETAFGPGAHQGERLCVPNHFLRRLDLAAFGASPSESELEKACAPLADERWSVSVQREAQLARDEGNAEGAGEIQLRAITCAYTWHGSEPAPTPRGLEPLCFQEPELPKKLVRVGCPLERQVGLRPPSVGECPVRDGWQVQPLFAEHQADILGRYCVYELDGEPLSPGAPLPPGAQALPAWVQPDCNVVGVRADASADAGAAPPSRVTLADIRREFLDGVERPDTLPLLSGGLVPTPVEVAVLDSARDNVDDGLPGRGNAAHGRGMANMILRLSCPAPLDPSSACVSQVRNRLALPLRRTPTGFRRDPSGGFFGSQTDLAQALVRTVDTSDPNKSIIINLSIGWTKFWGGAEALSSQFAPQVQAVYHALEYARCHGHLVIAAAGNAQGRPALPIGPHFPGGWANRPLNNARCARLGFAEGFPDSNSQPLVYAAGGVDNEDRPLFNTPLGGRPPLATPAWQGVVMDRAPAHWRPGGAYTGSSVAAAVTSAAAALVWAYRPGLTADAVIAEVYQSGIDLSVPADFCFGPACPSIRRVSLCNTVERACATGVCEKTPNCTTSALPRAPWRERTQTAFESWRATAQASSEPANPWGLPILTREPDEPICTVCSLLFDDGSDLGDFGAGSFSRVIAGGAEPVEGVVNESRLELSTNSDNQRADFATLGINLTDSLGQYYIDTSGAAELQFTGGDSVRAAVNVTGAVAPVTRGVIDFSYRGPDDWTSYDTEALNF